MGIYIIKILIHSSFIVDPNDADIVISAKNPIIKPQTGTDASATNNAYNNTAVITIDR